MGILQESLDVAAARHRVWEAVVDCEARPRWSSRFKSAQLVGGPPLREGSRIRLHIARDRFTATVVELGPPERLTLLVKGPGFRVNRTYELCERGSETRVTLTGEYRGVVGRLVARLMPRSIRRDLVDELAAIKAAAEE